MQVVWPADDSPAERLPSSKYTISSWPGRNRWSGNRSTTPQACTREAKQAFLTSNFATAGGLADSSGSGAEAAAAASVGGGAGSPSGWICSTTKGSGAAGGADVATSRSALATTWEAAPIGGCARSTTRWAAADAVAADSSESAKASTTTGQSSCCVPCSVSMSVSRVASSRTPSRARRATASSIAAARRSSSAAVSPAETSVSVTSSVASAALIAAVSSSAAGCSSAACSETSQRVSRRYAVLMADVQPLAQATSATSRAGQWARIDQTKPFIECGARRGARAAGPDGEDRRAKASRA